MKSYKDDPYRRILVSHLEWLNEELGKGQNQNSIGFAAGGAYLSMLTTDEKMQKFERLGSIRRFLLAMSAWVRRKTDEPTSEKPQKPLSNFPIVWK